MITVTFNFTDIAAAAALFGKLTGAELAATTVGVSAEEKQAVLTSNDKAETVKQLAAPGKPSAAKTAPSPRTAAADPSPAVQPDAAPAVKTEATTPAADASSASPPVTYGDMAKVVLKLHALDPSATTPIAKSLGADTFKLLPEAKWADAIAACSAKIAELQGA